MDLITLSDQLNVVFESSPDAHRLYQLVVTYKADEATKGALKEKKDIPPLINRALNAEESLRAILSDSQVIDPQADYRAVFRCLDLILYSTVDYMPFLNEKNGQNLAIAHPISLWLFKEHRSIEALYYVGMHLFRLVNKKDVPTALVRLAELVERFRTFVLSHMTDYHNRSIQQLREIKPDYMELGGFSQPKVAENPRIE